jgi:hypothetical protein
MSKPSPLAARIAGSILPVVVYGLLSYTWYVYIFRICGEFVLVVKYSPLPKYNPCSVSITEQTP